MSFMVRGGKVGKGMLERGDFIRCQLPESWDVVCDCNGDGVRAKISV